MEESTDQNVPLDLSQGSINSKNKKICTVTCKEYLDWNGNFSQIINKLIMEEIQDKSITISDSSIKCHEKESDESKYHTTSYFTSPKEKDLDDENACDTSSSTISAPEAAVNEKMVESDVVDEKIKNISDDSFLRDSDGKLILNSDKRPKNSSSITKKRKNKKPNSSPKNASILISRQHSKSMKPPCRCASRCYIKIDYNERIKIFQTFWKLENRHKQLEFILKYTEKYKIRQYTGCNRHYTFKYSLPIISKNKIIRVCKIMYINTLMLNVQIIKSTWAKFENEHMERNALLNKNVNNGTTDDVTLVISVRDHINYLSSLEMEYFGHNPAQLGSNQILNSSLSCMYASYNEWFDPEKYISKVTSQIQYSEIAKNNIIIDFHVVKQEQNKIIENHDTFSKKLHSAINDNRKFTDKIISLLKSENFYSETEPRKNVDKPSIEKNITEKISVSSSRFLIRIILSLTKTSKKSQKNIKRNQSLPNLDNATPIPVPIPVLIPALVEGNSIEAPCVCALKCYNLISYDERINLSKYFQALGNKRKQFEFIVTYTEKCSKKKCVSRSLTNYLNFTFKYKLPINLQNKIMTVCKQMFLNTLMVSENTVKIAWENLDRGWLFEQDNTDSEKIENPIKCMVKSVRDHVNSFAPVEAYFLGKKPNTLYLDGLLNITLMFRLYKQWFDHNKYDHMVEDEEKYKEIVAQNFNLVFHVMKNDQCDECQAFRELRKPNDEQTGRHIMHNENVIAVHNKKNHDKEDAIASNGKIITAIFNIEKLLACPHSKEICFYNKRKLLCFNFTIFHFGFRYPMCYMWDECVAKNEVDDICSCLFKFINFNIQNGVEELRFWSDSDERRNYVIFHLYSYIVSKYNVNIYHNFHIKHHIQSEVTNVDHVIEKLSSTKNIFTPEEWQNLVKCAKINSQEPFTVVNMTQSDFYNFCENVNYFEWQKDNTGKTISWSKVRELFISSANPFKIKFRYSYYEDYKVIDLKKDYKFLQISGKYKEVLPLNCMKYKDLMNLCNNGAIPNKYINFYKSLPHENHENFG